MKKYTLLIIIPIFSHAYLVQVPDNCLQEKQLPCLVKAQDVEEITKVNLLTIRMMSGAILKWNSFSPNHDFEVINGRIHAQQKQEKKNQSIQVNQVFMTKNNFLLQKKEDQLELLDLQSLQRYDYDLVKRPQKPEELDKQHVKGRFLDKADFVYFVSAFYPTKKKLNSFLKTVESLWRQQQVEELDNQTKVLQRSIASIQAERKKEEIAKKKNDAELKKVRELFFYRTFYR